VNNTGWTNLMLEADHRLMFRFPRWVGSAKSVGREVRLLEFLGERLTIPIPRPLLISTLRRPRGWPFFVYEKLPGSPLTGTSPLSRLERTRLTKFLVELFSELSKCPAAQLRRIGLPPGDKRSWEARFIRLEQRYRRIAAVHLPTALDKRIARLFEGFHQTLSVSSFTPTLIHGDLWPSHILWDRASRSPVGIIDWEDARLGDPAFDLTTFARIGPEFFDALVMSRKTGLDELFEERLLFYRRILPLPGLLFGMENRRAGIARAHLRQLRDTIERSPE
jgi:aminoglycoside 2''-phosphotransferase